MGNFPLAPRVSVKSVFCHSGIVVLVDLFFVGLEWARILIVLEASFDASASFVRVSLKSKLEDPEQYEVPFRLRRCGLCKQVQYDVSSCYYSLISA